MSEPFFYCPSLTESDIAVTLTGDEARHISGARRLRSGERVTLFNGHGLTATAELVGVRDRGGATDFRVLDRLHQPRMQPAIHLACALPKGDRLSTLLDMGTQLGMTSFTPLRCEHSVVKPGATLLERGQRICLEACKQSRRAWLPELRMADDPAAVVRAAAARGVMAWVAHPEGPAFRATAPDDQRDQLFLIGPEGGFTTDEIAAVEASGACRIGLGEGILRIETAALALLAAARLSAR